MAPDDEKILSGCLRGEKRAWDDFVERYSKLVYWSIWKVLAGSRAPDKQEACREMFQEFFRRMLERPLLEKLSQAQNVPKYLEVTARHLVLERFRRSEVLERTERPDEGADSRSTAADPAEEAAQAERRTILEAVLGRLKPKERECLELHYLDGHSHQRIGELLGMPRDTVSSILLRTREKLKQRLQKRGIQE